MARRVDDEIVQALTTRAGPHGRGRRRKIAQSWRRSLAFAEVLASMPDVGLDADFERVDSAERSSQVKDRG